MDRSKPNDFPTKPFSSRAVQEGHYTIADEIRRIGQFALWIIELIAIDSKGGDSLVRYKDGASNRPSAQSDIRKN